MSRGYLLDTNVPSELTKPSPEPLVSAWIASEDELYLSVVSLGELRRGIYLLPRGKRRTQLEEWFRHRLLPMVATRILPVTQSIADRWGMLSAERQIKGARLAMADGLIAATAFEHDLTLATRNVKDFEGLGLTILNPWSGRMTTET